MNSAITPELLKQYTDHKLEGRHRLALAWIDDNTDHLLDAGCSYGYATRFYAAKAKHTAGIELDALQIAIAKEKYPNIEFFCSSVDRTSFPDERFDCIVMTDVLEHVPDRTQALNELYRILRPGGSLIISTPHKGLFGFLDPYNYGYYLKKYFRPVYGILYKLVRFVKEGKFPTTANPIHSEKHHHFSLADYRTMLDTTHFSGKYTIERSLRSGLLVEALMLNMEVFLGIFLKNPATVRKILKPLVWLADMDYRLSYGFLAYNIMVKVRKAAQA